MLLTKLYFMGLVMESVETSPDEKQGGAEGHYTFENHAISWPRLRSNRRDEK
jgi:hypothetical protein